MSAICLLDLSLSLFVNHLLRVRSRLPYLIINEDSKYGSPFLTAIDVQSNGGYYPFLRNALPRSYDLLRPGQGTSAAVLLWTALHPI